MVKAEQDTITIFRGEDRKLELLSKNNSWPNSIGIFYLTSTAHLGYKLGDEYKVMGMSAYGRNKFEKYLKPSFKINNFGQLEILETKYVGFKNIENTAHQNFFYKNEFCKILPKIIQKNLLKSILILQNLFNQLQKLLVLNYLIGLTIKQKLTIYVYLEVLV